MNKFIALLALCAVSVSAKELVPYVAKAGISSAGAKGVVNPAWRCGGLGTPVQLRISGCEGYCTLVPGTRYDCEEDFFPASAAPSLSLRLQVCMSSGFCSVIIDQELAGSSVQPGNMYTARYSIVPNDILSGTTIEFRATIYHTDNGLEEICVAANIDIASF